jgi:hypothetical protein
VFFFTEPDNDSGVWPTPDEMLGSGNWPDLTKLIGPILDTPDPLDDEITGALVDGRFIVLHRDREDASGDNGSNRVFPMYLAVVWKGLDDDGVLIEERSAWVADQLSYLWQMSTLFVRDWLGRSEVIELKLRNVSDGLVRPSRSVAAVTAGSGFPVPDDEGKCVQGCSTASLYRQPDRAVFCGPSVREDGFVRSKQARARACSAACAGIV